MIPVTIARVIATRHAASYRRGDEPRRASTTQRIAVIVEFCRTVDRLRSRLIELETLCPVTKSLRRATIGRAFDMLA